MQLKPMIQYKHGHRPLTSLFMQIMKSTDRTCLEWLTSTHYPITIS